MVCSLIRLFFLFVHSLIRPFFYPSINFSHGLIHPPQIFLFCLKEPGESCGGETPLAKCSDIVSKLDPEVVKKFDVKGVMYVRYLPDKSQSDYMPWQHQFYTDDRKVIQLGSRQESHVRIECPLKTKNIVEISKENDDFQSRTRYRIYTDDLIHSFRQQKEEHSSKVTL